MATTTAIPRLSRLLKVLMLAQGQGARGISARDLARQCRVTVR